MSASLNTDEMLADPSMSNVTSSKSLGKRRKAKKAKTDKVSPANERNHTIEEKESDADMKPGSEDDELVYDGMSGDGETSGQQMLGLTKLSDGISTQPHLVEKYCGEPIV